MSADTPTQILHATHDALCKHGYAEVTMQDIADEVDLCKASIHYHYDGKQDLLLAYLDHLYEQFTEKLSEPVGEDAAERLYHLVDAFVSDREDVPALQTALLEIKAQSPYNDAFRERLKRFDETFMQAVSDVIEDGIEDGTFRDDIDPTATASFLTTFVNGVQTRRVAADHPPQDSATSLRRYIDETMRAEPPEDDTDRLDTGQGGTETPTE